MSSPITTVPDRSPVDQYTADGVVRSFFIPWPISDLSHLRVTFDDGNEPSIPYAVKPPGGVNDDSGFTIVFQVAPPAGTKITVLRQTPVERASDYSSQQLAFSAQAIDTEQSRVILMIQELRRDITQSVLQAITATPGSVLRLPAYSAGKYLRWDSATQTLVNSDVLVPDVDIPPDTVTDKYPADAGLSTASGFDNSAILNPYLRAMSAAGGGRFVLQSEDGAGYDFPDGIDVPSFVTLEMGSPVRLGPTASVAIRGDRDVLFTGATLVSDALTGATEIVVDVGGFGGGLLSDYFKIDGTITLQGGAGEVEGNAVAGIANGTRTLTLATPLQFDYGAAETVVRVIRSARFAEDSTLRSDQVTVETADVNLLSVGMWVMVEDSRTSGGANTHIEIRQIVGISGDVVSLNGRLRRVYELAEGGRLTVINPAVRAAVIGGSVKFTGTASVTREDPAFFISFALDSVMIDCDVPNLDLVGRRGPMHRVQRSYNSGFVRPTGRNPKFIDAGAGSGVEIAYSTRCYAERPTYEGTRHAAKYVCATECGVEELDASDNRLVAISHHGCNSVGCYTTIRQISWGSRTASTSNGAGVFGNPSFEVGDHECVISGGTVQAAIGGSSSYGFQTFAPSSRCYVVGVRAINIDKFFIHRDIAGFGDRISYDCGLIACSVDGGSDRVIDIQSRSGGATNDTLVRFLIKDFTATGLFRGIYADRVTDLTIQQAQLAFSSPDTSNERWALRFVNCTRLKVVNTTAEDSHRGVSISGCPAALFLRCDFLDLGDTQWLRDLGTSNGTEFRGCNAYTASGSAIVADTGGGSTITYKPVSNIGNETVAAYEFSATDKLLARVSSGAGTGEEVDFTDAGQAIVAAASGRAQNDLVFTQGADIASASTTDLATATGVAVTITGTTTITAFGTVAAGRIRILTFAGALTLTHNGTSLILPNAVSLTTAAGDVAIFLSLGSGNWRCVSYTRRTALGSMSGQNASSVSITGGSVTGITDLAIADGGTAASTAVAAIDNLSVKGADIASATTTDIGAATGDFIDITGTTTITGFGTKAAGVERTVRFTGALTLTHNATSLILPGGADITTAANDVAIFRSLGSGNWFCVVYRRSNGLGPLDAAALKTQLGLSPTTLQIAFDGGGAAIQAGYKFPIMVPWDCTITGWTIASLQTGSIVVDVWKDDQANFPPTVADTITGSEKPTISASDIGEDLTLTTWTTTLTRGQWLIFNVDSATTIQQALLVLHVNR
jgi:hypothetical protein